MAPQPPPRGSHHASHGHSHRGASATTRHHDRGHRNANTGAGVNRRAPRGHHSSGGRGRGRGGVTTGARLVDRMTMGDSRLADRMTGGGIRLADRITGGNYEQPSHRLVDRMTGGGEQRFSGEYAVRARPPRGRVRGVRERGGGCIAADRGESRGLGVGPFDGLVDVGKDDNDDAQENGNVSGNVDANANDNNDEDWDIDLDVKSTTSSQDSLSSLFYDTHPSASASASSHPGPVHPTVFSPFPSPHPLFPTIPSAFTSSLSAGDHEPAILQATSRHPIRMFNQPQSDMPEYQFVEPNASNVGANIVSVHHNRNLGNLGAHNNGNTYRGNDPIKKLVQNRKLQALLGDRRVPSGERKVSREESMRLRL